MRALAAIACLTLTGCAHGFLVLGVGYVHIDRQDRAIGIRSISVGLKVGCREAVLGVESSFCAAIPVDGNVAILEEGSRPNKHLAIYKLKGDPDEVFATARDR